MSAPTLKETLYLRLLGPALIGSTLCLLGYLMAMIVVAGYGLSRDRLEAWRLEHECRLVGSNAAQQIEIVDEVIDGKRTLAEAAAEFERLHGRLPAAQQELLRAYYPTTDADLFERRVISLVASRLEDHPEEKAAVLHRLESEQRAARQTE